MKAVDIMTREVVTASPDDSVDAIARMMLKHHIGACQSSMLKGVCWEFSATMASWGIRPKTARMPGGCNYLITAPSVSKISPLRVIAQPAMSWSGTSRLYRMRRR